jgi:hypothetical protein
MAFVNLPPNLQDLFGGITDRIAKLETGPNQAMYTAEGAQTTASDAQIQAINAGVQANNAASQATIAQSQATIASAQATNAQTSANGKNTNHYQTYGPGATANIAGDLWFQYGTSAPYTNKVIAQFVGLGGTSWQSMPITGLVVTNIDAGTITTGVLDAIEINAGTGGTAFHVSPTGYMSAQGVYVKGNITADSGTFTGSIRASDGYFGTGTGSTLSNGFAIGANGLTAVGTAYIQGGAIQGISIKTTSGSISSFNIDNNRLYTGNMNLNGTTGDLTANNITGLTYTGSVNLTGTGVSLTTGGSNNITASAGLYAAGHTTTGSAANGYVNATTGLIARSTASSQRYKHDIVNLTDVPELDPTALYELPVRAFRFNKDYLPKSDDRADVLVPGFIAEEVDAIYPAAADYNDGQVETWNDRMLVPGLLALIQDLNNRVKELETKLSKP